jgi:DNA-binding YbaB/EbfC family protein
MNNLIRQAQRMQNQMQQNKEKLEQQEFTAAAGGGAVSVTVTGDRKVKAVSISKDAVDPDDVETLEDLVLAAVNQAMEQVDEESQKLFGGMAGGL